MRSIFAILNQYSWLALLVAAPFLLFPSPERSLALLVIPGIWIVALLSKGSPLPATPLNGSLLLLSFMVLVSLYATFDIAVSLPNISGLLFGLAVYFEIVRRCSRPAGWRVGVALFLLACLGIAGMGLIATTWATEKFAWMGALTSLLPHRLAGTSGLSESIHPNILAGALLWGFPLFLALAGALILMRKGESLFRHRALAWAITVLTAIAALAIGGELLLTQSRESYLALAFTLVGAVLLLLPRKLRWIALAIIVLFAFAGLALAVTGNLQPLLPPSLVASFSPGAAAGSDGALSLGTLQWRVEIWSRAIPAIQDFPFTGMGMDTFHRVVQVLYPLLSTGSDVDISHAHNEFLQAALDLGIPGLIAFVSLYLTAFAMLVSTWKILQVDPQRSARLSLPGKVEVSAAILQAVILGLGAGLCAHLLFGLTDAVALGTKPGILFWTLLG
ncbi:MAG: O-antigen ligase family protein, partial [Anaerolineaceae bacterium]|nr:O-antigen ligase family protein [Anaerolineaceae bacterium]